ncbi:MAG: hypothetical protein EXR76_00075 [Myxococcales bacterium]|nr:hypothetical protein [Myxococcales bacterium]
MRNRHVPFAILLGASCLPGAVSAAELTDVIDAADVNDPYDANVEIEYGRSLRRAKITREFYCDPAATPDTCPNALPGVGKSVNAKELRFQRVTHVLTPRLRLSIWHDLELRVELPVVLDDASEVRFAGNGGSLSGVAVTEEISTVAPGPRTEIVNGEQQTVDPVNVFDVPPKLPSRSGFGDMALALRWSPYSQERDDARGTWTVELGYRLPTGEVMRAGNQGVGRGVHALTIGTALSRRLRWVEPYAGLDATFSFPSASSLFKDYHFAQERIGPGIVAGFKMGMEIIPFEHPPRSLKLYVDVGLGAQYHAEGRDYGELFDAFASGGQPCDPSVAALPELGANHACFNPDSKSELAGQPFDGLGTVEQYVTVVGHVGLGFYASRFFKLGTTLSLAHDTEHFLSSADVGEDLDASGTVESRLDDNYDANEQNPTYVKAVDAVGHRLRLEETTNFTAAFQAAFIF